MDNKNTFKTYCLRRIRLVNFHNFQNETLDLKEGGHLFLLGDNGSGKTTVLDAVHYVLSAGVRMDFNTAARVTGKKAEGRRVQGIVMRYNVDTGPMNSGGGVSYAAVELESGDGRPLTLGVGLSAFSMDERVRRWGVIKECSLEEIPWLMEEGESARVLTEKEMRAGLTSSGGYYNIGAFEKELARRLYGNGDVFRETCQFLSMGKAYRELAAGAGDYNQLFKMLLPEPKTELFERVIEALKSLDENTSLLEEMDKKLGYLRNLEHIVKSIHAYRESMARYRWLNNHFELNRLEALGRQHSLQREALQSEADGLKNEIRLNCQEQSRIETRVFDLQSKDAKGAVRQEKEVLRDKKERRTKADRLTSETESLTRQFNHIENEMTSDQNLIIEQATTLSEKMKDAVLPFSSSLQTLSQALETLVAAPLEDVFASNPESEWQKDVEAFIDGTLKQMHSLQSEAERNCREAKALDEEMVKLQAQNVLEPNLEGFSSAKAELKKQNLRAKALYELLEWNEEIDDTARATAEELIGEDVLCMFIAEENNHQAVKKVLLNKFPGLRVQRESAGKSDTHIWIRNTFDFEKSHPEALSCLAEEMEAVHGPFFDHADSGVAVEYRAHQRKLKGRPANWIGPEARERALQKRMTALRRQLKAIHTKTDALEKEIGELSGYIDKARAVKNHFNDQWRGIKDRQVQLKLKSQEREHIQASLQGKSAELSELLQEIEHLAKRASALREIITREGLEKIQEEIGKLNALRLKTESAYRSQLNRQGALEHEHKNLSEAEKIRVTCQTETEKRLMRLAEDIRKFVPDLKDVSYYVLRTQKGNQFTTPEHVESALKDAERKEAALQGGLLEKLNDPAFGSVHGFDYDESANRLKDRRERGIFELVEEQGRILEEQREVVTEKTNMLFKKIIIDEMVAFFALNVNRLERMVRDINRYLDERQFGQTRYRLDVRKLDKYRHFVEAVRKYNPLDGKNEDVLRQFIEDNREEIIYSEVDAIPDALDYRNWYSYNLKMYTSDSDGILIDRKTKSVGSGGEQAVPNYLTILTIAHFLFQGNRVRLPVLLFDEAFYGIDAGRRDQLLGFADDRGIQLLVASPDQDGVKKEVKHSTTLLVVKDAKYDVHLYPFHWKNPKEEQIGLFAEPQQEDETVRFGEELDTENTSKN